MIRVTLSPAARLDLRSITASYDIGTGTMLLGNRFIDASEAILTLLAHFPLAGRTRMTGKPKLNPLRSIPFDKPFNKYLIFYKLNSSHVTVLRIVHGAQDLRPMLYIRNNGDD